MYNGTKDLTSRLKTGFPVLETMSHAHDKTYTRGLSLDHSPHQLCERRQQMESNEQ